VTETAAGLEFRHMTEADLEAALQLPRARGWTPPPRDWRKLLALGPGLFRVAVRGAEIVASGGAVCYGEELAWICMILVRPDERGHGLGTRIFDEVLQRARARANAGRLHCIGLDATPAGRVLYLKRGFVDGPSLVRLRREPGAPSPVGVAAMRALTASDLDAVLARDRAVFGADRSLVLRALARAAPELARVVHDGEHLRGYCFGRHGDHSDELGPVVADDEALARELVVSALTEPRQRPLIVDARALPRWVATLGELGFREERPLTRMYLGDTRPTARPEHELGILGPEFG
jgi:GNAT superfamily N-acetyltransferase